MGAWKWGYSPKVEKFIPLGYFSADRYLIIAMRVIENLGWKLSHISATGIIAYTNISLQSYSEEVSIRIDSNFALFKSECIGVQMLFTDYGKNEQNMERFFNEFDYVEYHLESIWEQEIDVFEQLKATQDDSYFERAPLVNKDKIKNVLYLFYPQKGYRVTPVIVLINIFFWLFCVVFLNIAIFLYIRGELGQQGDVFQLQSLYLKLGANSRDLVLKGEWWRLLTQQFMHFSFFHLFFNMYALIYIGLMVEPKLGSIKTLVVYILSGVCGGVLSVAMHTTGIMGGASGPILGMFGALLALMLCKAFEKNANKALFISTAILVAYMLINGAFTRRVDNAAHIGGLISGFVICYLLYNERPLRLGMPVVVRYMVSVLLVVLTAGFSILWMPNYQQKEFEKLQGDFVENSRAFNQVYYIERSFPKAQKLQIIQSSGLDKWKANQHIVKQMEKLVLDEKYQLRRRYNSKMAEKGYLLATLMYKQTEAGDKQYQREITAIMTEMSELGEELRVRLEKID